MIAYAKEMGAKGITISGVCCTSNEVAMRRGIPMAGNFLQQENVVLTGACEAIVVDVQCFRHSGCCPSASTQIRDDFPDCTDAGCRVHPLRARRMRQRMQRQS